MDEVPERGKQAADPELEQIIERISTEHSFDVRGYRRSTLYRRIRKRMSDASCPGVEDYLVRLETDPQEHTQLINTILINVTRLFRDQDAWDFLQKECLPELLRLRASGEPVRVWSTGCATGEEAYSTAISLTELLGEASLRDVKIYATDVDEEALTLARAGVYEPESLQNVSRERVDRFFDPLSGGTFKIRRDLRSIVIFGRHNVLEDPPISRLDLLICRNLLIYLDTESQTQLLSRFHYALRPGGYLFLGKAETLMTRSTMFQAIEPRFRIFERGREDRAGGPAPFDSRRPREQREPGPLPQNYALQTIVTHSSSPLVLLDPTGHLLMTSEAARALFNITPSLMGRNLLELEERFRPPALRLALEEVRATSRPVRIEDLQIPRPDGTMAFLSADVQPVLDPRGALARILIWAQDVTRERQLGAELTQVRHDLETINEELQCTNEELETANEELQCTNEELETTNEELQSTNEELETTIEELQSTNEEMETTNEELHSRQDELNSLTRYQDMILSSLNTGLVVLNQQLQVTSWNRTCEETWGLREQETVGRDFFSLDIGLPTQALREPAARLLQGERQERPLVLAATNRRGRGIHCTVWLHPLLDGSGQAAGAMIIIEEKAEQQN